jgi:hypothetical protein
MRWTGDRGLDDLSASFRGGGNGEARQRNSDVGASLSGQGSRSAKLTHQAAVVSAGSVHSPRKLQATGGSLRRI